MGTVQLTRALRLVALFVLFAEGCTSSHTSCITSRDCPGLVCDVDEGICVECLTSTDCLGVDEACRDHTCVPIVRCTTSRQCPGQVCDLATEMCVDCLGDPDCAAGERCNSEHLCERDDAECTSDDACEAPTPHCDRDAERCVACLSDTDCASTARCTDDRRCVARGTDAGPFRFDAGPTDAGPTDAGPMQIDGGPLRTDGGLCPDPVTERCDASVHLSCREIVCGAARLYCTNVAGVWTWRTGNACNDGSACTYGDVCNAGSCAGTSITCTSTECMGRVCNGTSSCSESPRTGLACNDGNLCTSSDACQATGLCGGTTVTCPPNDTCATYACNGTSTCTRTPRNLGVGCSDGNLCTRNETCQASGLCGAGITVTCPPATDCANYACNGTATCTLVPTNLGVGCFDTNLCTSGETCQASGVCGGGAPVICPAATTCATYECDGTPFCATVARNVGGVCDDGDPITTDDRCELDGRCRGMPDCPSGSATVFIESFTTPATTGWVNGTNVGVGASQWRGTADTQHGVQITAGQMLLTNQRTAALPQHGQAYAWVDTRTAYDASFYSSTLASNTATSVVWTFNMRRSDDDPTAGGFNCSSPSSQNYFTLGVAYVLGSTSASGLVSSTAVCTPTGTANGYAIVRGGAGSLVRLVRFTNGLRNGTLTNIAQSAAMPAGDHLSVRVTYTPATDAWALEARSDGPDFVDPRTGSYPAATSGIDGTYTHAPLDFAGPYFQSGCTSLCTTNYTAEFDNLDVTVNCP